MNLSTSPPTASIRRSLRYSLGDGFCWSLTVGFAELYFSPFALFQGAANVLLGLITTLPQFLGSLFQLSSSFLVRKSGSRKRFILWGLFAQGAALAAVGLSYQWSRFSLWVLLMALIVYWGAWLTITPAWQSWLADLVPSEERGRYFGRRNRLIQATTFAAFVVGGGILYGMSQDPSTTYLGFLFLLALGVIGRFGSALFIRKQADISLQDRRGERIAWRELLTRREFANYRWFLGYTALISLAVQIAGPFFLPYLLQELHFSYLQFMGLIAIFVAAKSLFSPWWGRVADRYGARKPFILASFVLAATPLLWLPAANFYYLMAIQIAAGWAWAGFEICSFNFLLEATPSRERMPSLAVYQLTMGIGMVLGSILGGLLAQTSLVTGATYRNLFLISGIARYLLSFVLLPRLKANRPAPEVSYRRLFLQTIWFERGVVE